MRVEKAMLRCRVIVLVWFELACVGACALPHLGGAPIVRFQGETTDPVGDTAGVGDSRVRRPADLVYAGVRVTDAEVRFNVRFAPGTFDPMTTSVMFLLDTDIDSTTGVPGLGVGSEYAVSLVAQPARQGSVARAVIDADCGGTPCRFEPFEPAKVVTSDDAIEAVVRRRAFTHFDGRANVSVVAWASLDGGHSGATTDHVPNFPLQFFEVRSASAVLPKP
jgi:hypothetical protein